MPRPLVSYCFGIVLVGFVHYLGLLTLGRAPAALFFWECYGLNIGLTFLLLGLLLKAFNRLSHYVAWFFMLGSALKFILFFWLLWPLFYSDGTLDIFEKTTFLIPYGSSLLLETRILIQKLNKI